MSFSGAKLALFLGADLLVIKRDDRPDIPYPGYWDLPGGGREGDETPQACALRETYEETVESYLALVFVKNNKDFIELTLENHPIIRTNFKDLYKSYLSMIVDPNDEENYNPNNMYYYQLLQRAQNLYC